MKSSPGWLLFRLVLILIYQYLGLVKPTMMSDITRLRKQLEVAADALREIECLTNNCNTLLYNGVTTVHKIAQDGYRAAKGEGK